MTNKYFSGEPGRWLFFECLIPYILVILAWPFVMLFAPTAPSWSRVFFQTFATPDVWAVALCLLAGALVDHWVKESPKTVADIEFGYIGLILISMIVCTGFYWGIKSNPVLISDKETVEIPTRAYYLATLSWLGGLSTSSFIYLRLLK